EGRDQAGGDHRAARGHLRNERRGDDREQVVGEPAARREDEGDRDDALQQSLAQLDQVRDERTFGEAFLVAHGADLGSGASVATAASAAASAADWPCDGVASIPDTAASRSRSGPACGGVPIAAAAGSAGFSGGAGGGGDEVRDRVISSMVTSCSSCVRS